MKYQQDSEDVAVLVTTYNQEERKMETFVGTKVIKGQYMTRGEYNIYRGWQIPAEEDPADDGYLVEYEDKKHPNHPKHEGYISWSPAVVFEEAYHEDTELTFSDTLLLLKRGYKMARNGWNGKGLFVFLVPGSTFKVNRAPLLGIYEEGTEINYHAHIDIKSANGEIVPWHPSQTDILANDWCIS